MCQLLVSSIHGRNPLFGNGDSTVHYTKEESFFPWPSLSMFELELELCLRENEGGCSLKAL
jgi:hypothetical protein